MQNNMIKLIKLIKRNQSVSVQNFNQLVAEQCISGQKPSLYQDNLKNISILNLRGRFQNQYSKTSSSSNNNNILKNLKISKDINLDQNDNIINGNKINQEILKELKTTVKKYTENNRSRKPRLALISVGTSDAANSYINKKLKICKRVGIQGDLFNFSTKTNPEKIIKFIQSLNKRKDIDSISIEMPLPSNAPKYDLINSISPEKDIDCLQQITNFSSMKMAFQKSSQNIPCTPKAIMYILDKYQVPLFQKNVVIVGKGMLVGYPLSALMIQRFASVQTIDEFTPNPEQYIKQADIIVSAAGKRHLIKEDFVKEGAIVIDVGANAPIEGDKTKIVGDVDFENVQKKARLITPVPGGVGPVTSALYLQNVINAWKKNITVNRVYEPHSHFNFESSSIKCKNSN